MKALTPTEIIAWQPPPYRCIIGQNILLNQGTLMLYGREESWKSMLVELDMAFRIANGEPWFGYKTTPVPIMVFQTEIPLAPLRDRMIKYMTGNKLQGNRLWYSSDLYMKIDKGWGFAELEKELDRTGAKLLVVDPIFSSMSGKLTDDYDVGLYLDRLDMLRDKYKIAVILIHHTRLSEHCEGQTYHYGSEEIFGSSRWNRWLDTIIYVDKIEDNVDSGLVTLRMDFEKTRHAENKLPSLFVRGSREDLVFSKMSVL